MTAKPISELVRADIRAAAGYTPGEQVNNCTKLNTNESAWPPSPQVKAVLSAVANDQLRLYPSPLADVLCETAAKRYGLSREHVLAGNGSDDCLTILYRSHLQPGDRVACPWPTYGLYDTLATIQGVQIEHRPYLDVESDDAWGLPNDLAKVDAKLLLIANPNNPSGTLIPRTDILSLADHFDGILVVDEAYIDFSPAGSSVIDAIEQHPNLVVLRTFSKSYSLAGARLGLMFAHPELIKEYRKVKDSYNVNALTQAIGCAALADRDHHEQLVSQTLAGRDQLEAMCAECDWAWTPSAANFILVRIGEHAYELQQALKARGILVRWWNQPELRDRIRITVGTPKEMQTLQRAIKEILSV